ncbi:MAG: hypothetical protein JO345_09260 [Streptosporangiaceae bacterium]|nr:hypothetical protein [Streptosporangiaceae bacterium]
MARLGFIGAGALAKAMGGRLEAAGHQVSYASSRGGHDQVVAGAEVVVLAVPFAAVESALGALPPLAGRVLWSCVNALRPDLSGLAVGFDTSAAERVAALVPSARVVAALPPFASALASNSLAYDAGLNPTTFVCGDDAPAKKIVMALIADLGAHAVDAGGLSAARYAEPAMMLLVSLAYGSGAPRDIGLRLLER